MDRMQDGAGEDRQLGPRLAGLCCLGLRELFRGRCVVLGDVNERVGAEAAVPCP